MKKIVIFGFIFSQISFLNADVAHGVLEKHPNKVFFGSGVGACINIARALNAGFSEIYSIESDEVLALHSNYVVPIYINEKRRPFLRNNKVYYGDSKTELFGLIKDINVPITFLLGGHLPDPAQPDKENGILLELDQIGQHPIKAHTIMIDYINYAGTDLFGGVTLMQIQQKLLEINPDYVFKFEKGGHLEREENMILVAFIVK